MGPIALYKFDELENKKLDNRLKWIDHELNINNLRTNDSEDDLIFKQQPEPIMNHKVGASVKPIIKSEVKEAQVDANTGMKFNFYKPEEKQLETSFDNDLEAHQTEDITKTNTISGLINYDPIVGNKELGNTMPLPKKNNLLESNRNKMEEDIACKKFLEQIKEGDGIHKKPIKEKNIKAFNYIIDNKKKIKKDSSKRKKSAKTRENENKKLIKVSILFLSFLYNSLLIFFKKINDILA